MIILNVYINIAHACINILHVCKIIMLVPLPEPLEPRDHWTRPAATESTGQDMSCFLE